MGSKNVLNSAGLKATKERSLILDVLNQGHVHQDADEVYRKARKKDRNLSLSTVYRTLNLFKKKGLVEELHFDEAHHHYEASPSAEHYHLVCLDCGKVTEFSSALTKYLKTSVPEAKNFKIVKTEVNLTGYCQDCSRKQ